MKKTLLTAAIVAAYALAAWAVQTWHDRRASGDAGRGWLALVAISLIALLVLLLLVFTAPSFARDTGHWNEVEPDPAVHQWYRTLERPDAPGSICCTEADAYYADEVHVRGGKTFATITDDRPDAPLGRPHIKNGTEFEVPPEKLKWDRGNPTGHNVLFISVAGFTWCFVMGTGI